MILVTNFFLQTEIVIISHLTAEFTSLLRYSNLAVENALVDFLVRTALQLIPQSIRGYNIPARLSLTVSHLAMKNES